MNQLKLVLNEMKASTLIGDEKEMYFVKKYTEVSDKYPMVIKRACVEGFDYSKMFWMINKQNEVQNKMLSQHDASVEVGECLVNDHVKPLLQDCDTCCV